MTWRVYFQLFLADQFFAQHPHIEMPSSKPNMEKFLRNWRQSALNKAQFDAAIFVGDKMLALTSRQLNLPQGKNNMLTHLHGLLQMTTKTRFG